MWYGVIVTRNLLLIAVLSSFVASGCVSTHVKRGATIGAISGATLGAGTGLLVTDPDLLGSEEGPGEGAITLSSGAGIGVGVLVGAMVGAIVGAMVGHQRENPYEPPPQPASSAHASITPTSL